MEFGSGIIKAYRSFELPNASFPCHFNKHIWCVDSQNPNVATEKLEHALVGIL